MGNTGKEDVFNVIQWAKRGTNFPKVKTVVSLDPVSVLVAVADLGRRKA